MGFKTRDKDRNKTVGHGTRQPRDGTGKPATVAHIRRVARGQGETNKHLAKIAKARRGRKDR